MKIIIGSENPSKKRSVIMALTKLGISDFEIFCIKTDSLVSSKPIGFEIIRGAENRNKQSKVWAKENSIQFDYVCGIEGGFSIDENGIPFNVTYAIIENNKGKKSTGKSSGVRIRKDMFDFLKEGGSLNKLIGELSDKDNNKQNEGISGYLSNGFCKRDQFDKEAVISALIPFLFKDKRDALSKKIEQLKSIS